MGNFGLSGSIPWHCGSDGTSCFISKDTSFLIEFMSKKFSSSLKNSPGPVNLMEYTYVNFIDNFDLYHKVLLPPGALVTNTSIDRFIVAAVSRVHKLC